MDRNRTVAPVARVEFPALGGLAVVLTTDVGAAERAAEAVRSEVAAIDAACSRFRADSELSRVNAGAGTFVAVSPLFAEALEAALWAAEATGGDVDPTCGAALCRLGYDVDFAAIADAVAAGDKPGDGAAGTVMRWRTVEWDREGRRVRNPAGTVLDFGATAKALAADRAAARAAWAAS
ncbi:MAG: FAD:protein FMN transferase, partial [Streptomycetaceae bacterium]|nr:FAD:protein FMN transferase [Streptomycetaceae bacterium]